MAEARSNAERQGGLPINTQDRQNVLSDPNQGFAIARRKIAASDMIP
jgi:transcription initiation factor TFIID subunit TAF12